MAEREKFKTLWVEREQHQAGQTVNADEPAEIRRAFEEFRAIGETAQKRASWKRLWLPGALTEHPFSGGRVTLFW